MFLLLPLCGDLGAESLFCDVVLGIHFSFNNHLAEGEREGLIYLTVLWLSVFCVSSSRCHGWLVCCL